MIRFPTREVIIGSRPLGGINPIRLQSMTNTSALDSEATFDQAVRIFEAGADYVRISTPNIQSVKNLEKIRKELSKAGFEQPLIADIHFKPELALKAARLVEKVRINPGNYNASPKQTGEEWSHHDHDHEQELEQIKNNVFPLLKVCREYGTAIRIGTNFASLSQRIIYRYGNTPEGMVQSTFEFLKIFEDQGFYNTVISLKASNPLITIQSYLLMVERMLSEGMDYPLHVGVTEAGEGKNGRIKSALGISTLLQVGIGDTIRVSLSEAPEAEIPVAQKIVAPFQEWFSAPAPEGSAFHIAPLDWLSGTTPNLPGGHKAVVIQTESTIDRREIHFFPRPLEDLELRSEKNRPDLIFKVGRSVSEHNTVVSLTDKIMFCPDSGEKYPVFKESQLLHEEVRYHPEFNFIKLSGLPQPMFYERLKNIPGAVILWKSKKGNSVESIQNLVKNLKLNKVSVSLIPADNCRQTNVEDFLLELTARWGRLLLERKIHGLWIKNSDLPTETVLEACFGLFQATGLRITRTEFISCPTCGRTSFDLLKVLQEVKSKTGHLSGLKIAVMGCIVNGPGEMADADYGILGAGHDKVHLYKGNRAILKNIPQDQAAQALLDLITQMNTNELK